jgi:hypothetical protein
LYAYHFNWRNEAGKSNEKFLNTLSFYGGGADDFTRQRAHVTERRYDLMKHRGKAFSCKLPKMNSSTKNSPAK